MVAALKRQMADGIQDLNAQLLRTKSELSKGTVLDISHLEPKVGELCRNLGQLSPSDARDFKVGLLGIIEELDHLEELLKSDLENVKTKLGETSERQRALNAYGQGKP